MPTPLDWTDVLLRLGLALLAGALLGIDRTSRGRPAGMRTTMMVCVASAIAMVLAEIVVQVTPAPSGTMTRLDPLRMAQGILAGMGFIGAGAIVRRDDIVHGITTAAALWFACILGLSFGSGEWLLGAMGLVIGCVILWPLHMVEDRIDRERTGLLVVKTPLRGPGEEELRAQVQTGGYTTSSWSVDIDRGAGECILRCRVAWKAAMGQDCIPPFVQKLAARSDVLQVKWEPVLS